MRKLGSIVPVSKGRNEHPPSGWESSPAAVQDVRVGALRHRCSSNAERVRVDGADLDVIIRQSLGCLIFRITFRGPSRRTVPRMNVTTIGPTMNPHDHPPPMPT